MVPLDIQLQSKNRSTYSFNEILNENKCNENFWLCWHIKGLMNTQIYRWMSIPTQITWLIYSKISDMHNLNLTYWEWCVIMNRYSWLYHRGNKLSELLVTVATLLYTFCCFMRMIDIFHVHGEIHNLKKRLNTSYLL